MKFRVGQVQLETLQNQNNLENTKLRKKNLVANLDAIRLDAIGPSGCKRLRRAVKVRGPIPVVRRQVFYGGLFYILSGICTPYATKEKVCLNA